MTENEQEDPIDNNRRWLGAALLGALGSSVLSGCANQVVDGGEPTTGTSVSELTANTATYTTLRALAPPPSTDEAIVVHGRASNADGGEGLFIWDPTFIQVGTAPADDDGTYIKPNSYSDGTAGRWRRAFSGPINVRWFGANPDGATDSTAAIVAALKSAVGTCPVYFPRGTYLVDADTLNVANYVLHAGGKLIGENHSGTPISTLKAGSTGEYLLESANRLLIENLVIDCDRKVNRGVVILSAHVSGMRRVFIQKALKNGVFTGNISAPVGGTWATGEAAGLQFENVIVQFCGEAGFKLLGASASLFEGCSATWNGGPGFEIHGSGSSTEEVHQSGGVVIIGGEISNNGYTNYQTPSSPGTMNYPQLVVRGVEWARFEAIYMEAGTQPAVRIQDSSRAIALVGLRVGGGSSVDRAFHLLGVQGCSVLDCHAQGGSYYPGVRIEDDSTSIAHGNTVTNGDTMTPGVYYPLTVERVTAAGSWEGKAVEGALVASEPPTVGVWKEGQFVRNNTIATDGLYVEEEPLGWICQNGANQVWNAIYPKKPPVPPTSAYNPLNGNISDCVLSPSGNWYQINGGYDGKRMTLINTSDTYNMTVYHMYASAGGSNIHLTGGVNASVPPGGTISLIRATLSGTQSWGDANSMATRWREISRSF